MENESFETLYQKEHQDGQLNTDTDRNHSQQSYQDNLIGRKDFPSKRPSGYKNEPKINKKSKYSEEKSDHIGNGNPTVPEHKQKEGQDTSQIDSNDNSTVNEKSVTTAGKDNSTNLLTSESSNGTSTYKAKNSKDKVLRRVKQSLKQNDKVKNYSYGQNNEPSFKAFKHCILNFQLSYVDFCVKNRNYPEVSILKAFKGKYMLEDLQGKHNQKKSKYKLTKKQEKMFFEFKKVSEGLNNKDCNEDFNEVAVKHIDTIIFRSFKKTIFQQIFKESLSKSNETNDKNKQSKNCSTIFCCTNISCILYKYCTDMHKIELINLKSNDNTKIINPLTCKHIKNTSFICINKWINKNKALDCDNQCLMDNITSRTECKNECEKIYNKLCDKALEIFNIKCNCNFEPNTTNPNNNPKNHLEKCFENILEDIWKIILPNH